MNLVIDKTLVASSNLVLQIIADHHFIKNKKKFYIKFRTWNINIGQGNSIFLNSLDSRVGLGSLVILLIIIGHFLNLINNNRKKAIT